MGRILLGIILGVVLVPLAVLAWLDYGHPPVAVADHPHTLVGHQPVTHQVSVLLEVEGAGHYLPAYAGNLDIMTSAALRVGERIAARTPVKEMTA